MIALKENIRTHVIGLGWSDLAIPWSKHEISLTVSDLTAHLKTITVQQKEGKFLRSHQ